MNLYFVGRNYVEHAKELGNKIPEKPLIFMKPTHSLVNDAIFKIPSLPKRIDYEVEIVVKLGIKNQKPMITHYSVGIDFTARDLQDEAKKNAHPWLLSKGLKGFTRIAPFIEASKIQNPENLSLELKLDSEVKQKGHTSQMIFSYEKLIDYLDTHFGLGEGDIIFTGTPAGVGPIHNGAKIECSLKNSEKILTTLKLTCES